MALTNRPLVLCSITTESVARVTSDPVAWDLGLWPPHTGCQHEHFWCRPPWLSWAVQDNEAGGGPVWALELSQPAGRAERLESLSLPGPWSSPLSGTPHRYLITWTKATAWVPLKLSHPLIPSTTAGILHSPLHPPFSSRARSPPESSLDHSPVSCLDAGPHMPKVASMDPAFPSRIPP